MNALSKITVKNDTYEIKDSVARIAITDEITRAQTAEAALQKQIDEIPTTGGGTGEIADGAVTEKKLSIDVANKLNTAYDKATLADTLFVNDGITFIQGGYDSEGNDFYPGTNAVATSLAFQPNGERITVNDGYVITRYFLMYNGDAVDWSDVRSNYYDTGEFAGTEELCLRIEIRKSDDTAINASEYPNIVKSFIRKPVAWSASCNMNNFVCAGRYVISGSREANAQDNMPILNGGNIEARLEVLESDNTLVQILTLLNVGGGDGNIYTRTRQDNTWGQWGKLQTNVEVGVINQQQMDALIDNGIYSGILSTTGETFVIICINNYAIATQAGYGGYISHLKYSVGLDGVVKVETRRRDAYGFWTDWQSIGGGSGSSYTLPVATGTILGGIKSATSRPIGSDVSEGRKCDVYVDGNSGLAHVVVAPASGSSYGVVKVDSDVNADSPNPVQNKAIAEALEAAVAKGRELAKRDLYISAGALYNDTDEIIKRTAFWGEEVDHLPKHYYLNGLGDITEEQMAEVYNTKDYITMMVTSSGAGSRIFQGGNCPRTLLGVLNSRYLETKNLNSGGSPIFANSKIEVVKWNRSENVTSYNNSFKLGQSIFHSCNSLRVIERCAIIHAKSFALCPKLEFFEIHGLAMDFDISGSPLVNKTSILYTINNATATKTITITLHADAYARLANDADVVDALNVKNTALASGGGSINLVSA